MFLVGDVRKYEYILFYSFYGMKYYKIYELKDSAYLKSNTFLYKIIE